MTDSDPAARTPRAWAGLYARGVAMGVAEVVPGVSGGTIAFVSGIYDELIRSLAGFRPSSVRVLRRGVRAFWREHNLSFLVVLALGMATGIGAFAQVLSAALAAAKPVVWGFFFGVILFSVLVLARQRTTRSLLIFLPPGLLAALALVNVDPAAAGEPGYWVFFLGGAVAVGAWMLPAVSGSFLLLALGLYESVLNALVNLEMTVLAALAAGCLVGLVSFANLLAWLLARYREPLLSVLTGFMAGSLVRLWPWSGPSGEILGPDAYAAMTGGSAFIAAVAGSALAGMAAIWLLSRLE
jgi:putative membrane protein